MAVIDSRTANVLAPISAENTSSPEDVIRIWLSLLTGLPKNQVRKRWLRKPGTRPGLDTDWCSVGVLSIKTLGTPYQAGHKGEIDDPISGDVTRESHQQLSCVASFYGPNAQEIADTFREGAQLFQNASALKRQGLVIQSVGEEVRHLADLLFEQWVDRYDVTFVLGRKVTRKYGVRDLASVGRIDIFTDKGKL